MKKKKVKVSVPAHCEKCEKTFYSQTSNKDGKITCPNCDKDLNQK